MRFDEETRGAFEKDMWPSNVDLYLNLDKYERVESVREREIDIANGSAVIISIQPIIYLYINLTPYL